VVLSALAFVETAVGLAAPMVFNSMLQFTRGLYLFWVIAGLVVASAVLLFFVKSEIQFLLLFPNRPLFPVWHVGNDW
jgi:hypothetical protein